MSDHAVKLAISSRWDEAVAINRDILRLFGGEAEVYNRLGKALSEVGQIADAREAYRSALERDPANTIAKRNLDRLAAIPDEAAARAAPSQLDTRLFVEETGKSTVAGLLALDANKSGLLDAGDLVQLQVQGKSVNVVNMAGDYVGLVEPRIGLRLAKLMTTGNRYSAAIVSSQPGLRVMIRETHQHPANVNVVSFPQAKASDVRAYTRRGLLRTADDVEYGDEDDGEEEETEEAWGEGGEEPESGDNDLDSEDESFD
jgi:tetratricopeptide (TPR) repeat protein